MERKLKNHIAWLESLENEEKFNGDFRSVMQQIIENRKYFQHERMIHLIVTLGFGIFLLLTFCLFTAQAELKVGILLLVLFVLESLYIVHYYRLENGVQKIWEIEQRLYEKSRSQ